MMTRIMWWTAWSHRLWINPKNTQRNKQVWIQFTVSISTRGLRSLLSGMADLLPSMKIGGYDFDQWTRCCCFLSALFSTIAMRCRLATGCESSCIVQINLLQCLQICCKISCILDQLTDYPYSWQLGAKDQSSPAINLQNFELLYIRTKSLHSTPQLTTHIHLNLVWDNPTSYFCVRMCAVGLKIANYFRNRSCCTQ
jgi:hypothetical protein